MSLPYLIILTVVGWGVGSLFYKVANDNIHPFMVSAIVTLVYLVETPVVFSFVKFDKTINSNGLIFSILGGTFMALGSMGYFFALKKGGAGEITAASAIYPALTLLLSIFFLGEDMTWRKGIGIIFALASVFLLSFK